MDEITIYKANTPSEFHFKSELLNEASRKIAKEVDAINKTADGARKATETFNRNVSVVLFEVMDKKLYTPDGFKSVADYAEQVFGIKRSYAYMLARAAGRVKAIPELSSFKTSNVAELSTADGVAVKQAIESGEISEASTQTELREFAAKNPAKQAKAKIEPTYNIYTMDGKLLVERIAKGWFLEALQKGGANPINIVFIKLDGDKPSGVQHGIFYDEMGHCKMFAYKPYTPDKPKTKSFLAELQSKFLSGEVSEEEYIAALKAARDERGKEA